jgi:hypothetical protein
MVNRRISIDLKECALRMWESGWDQELIIESLGISCASLYRWQALFLEFNSVVQPPSPIMGQLRIILCAVMTAIKEVYNNEADVYLDKLVWWLAIHHDIAIT